MEDEFLLSLDLELILSDAGINIVGPAATIPEALKLIETERFDAALLDANLSGNSVDSIAKALATRGTPFLFVTCYMRDSLPIDFQSRPVVPKPFSSSSILSGLKSLFAG